MYRSCIDELEKLGAISHTQAKAALENLENLEQNKTTPEQALRYGGFGAATGVAAGGLTDMIRGKKIKELYEGVPGVKGGRLRNIAALGVGGAIAGGGLPLLRQHMDRHIEMGKLRKFMQEHQPQLAPEPDDGKIVGPTHGNGMVVTASVKESTFTESQYSGGTGGPPFVLVSGLANKPPPRLDAPLGLESELRKKQAEYSGEHADRFVADHPVLHALGGGLVGATGGGALASLFGDPTNGKHLLMGAVPGAVLGAAVAAKGGKDLRRHLAEEDREKRAFMGQKGSTPRGHLASSSVQGGPKITTPAGPSIASIAKPKDPKISRMAGVTMPKLTGWGRPIAGAMK